jgi:hypothetical protein
MNVTNRTLIRAGLHTEAEITVLREWSNKIHKEGIKGRGVLDFYRSARVHSYCLRLPFMTDATLLPSWV